MGAKMSPIMNRVGNTALGVSIGCHALSRCCLNAVSNVSREEQENSLAGRFDHLTFSFWVGPSTSGSLSFPLDFLLKIAIMMSIEEQVMIGNHASILSFKSAAGLGRD